MIECLWSSLNFKKLYILLVIEVAFACVTNRSLSVKLFFIMSSLFLNIHNCTRCRQLMCIDFEQMFVILLTILLYVPSCYKQKVIQ